MNEMNGVRVHCIDTSALVKLFVKEPESERVIAYLGQHGVLSVTAITFSEVLGVLKSKWHREELTQEKYLAASEELAVSVSGGSIQIDDSVSLTERKTFDKAEMLCKKYTLDLADALQLVAMKDGFFSGLAGESKPIMITADGALASAAKNEGLRVWNCRETNEPEC